MKKLRASLGFTIAELLIVLLVLGEIATFTIPKVIVSQQSARFNAIAKEDMATLAQAHQLLKMSGQLSANITSGALTQYLNYVSIDTSSQIDDAYGYAGSQTCSAGQPCARLTNGSLILFSNCSYGGTGASTNVIEAFIDPDGQVTNGGGANTDGKAVRTFIYYSGRTVSWSGVSSGSTSSCFTWGTYTDPPYLQY